MSKDPESVAAEEVRAARRNLQQAAISAAVAEINLKAAHRTLVAREGSSKAGGGKKGRQRLVGPPKLRRGLPGPRGRGNGAPGRARLLPRRLVDAARGNDEGT